MKSSWTVCKLNICILKQDNSSFNEASPKETSLTPTACNAGIFILRSVCLKLKVHWEVLTACSLATMTDSWVLWVLYLWIKGKWAVSGCPKRQTQPSFDLLLRVLIQHRFWNNILLYHSISKQSSAWIPFHKLRPALTLTISLQTAILTAHLNLSCSSHLPMHWTVLWTLTSLHGTANNSSVETQAPTLLMTGLLGALIWFLSDRLYTYSSC